MKKNLFRIIIIAMLLVGAVFDIFIIAKRTDAELNDRSAAAAMYYHDVVRLERESGIALSQWLETLSDGGLRYLIFGTKPSEELKEALSALNISCAAMGNLEGDWAFVVPIENKPLRELGDTPLAIMKNPYRTGIVAPADFDMETYPGPVIKASFLYAGYAARYSDEKGAKEVENILFRAVTDEGVRVLILKPITYPDHSPVTDPGVYGEMLDGLSERLHTRGYSFGKEFSTLRLPPVSSLSLWLRGILPLALWLILLTRFNLLRRFGSPLALLALAGMAGACWLMPSLAQKLLPLACSLGFSLSMIYWLYKNFPAGRHPLYPALPSYLLGLFSLLLWSCLGGLALAATQSSMSYIMGESIFAGVKLSMMLPLAVCGLSFGIPILRDILKGNYSKKELLCLIPVALAVLAALAILIRRSGDIFVISSFELKVRDFLEYSFYARPRSKDVFAAVPFAALMFVSAKRKNGILRLIGALCCTIECSSILNSFSHGFTPLHVSFLRSAVGAGAGCVLGLIVIGVFCGAKAALANKIKN